MVPGNMRVVPSISTFPKELRLQAGEKSSLVLLMKEQYVTDELTVNGKSINGSFNKTKLISM